MKIKIIDIFSPSRWKAVLIWIFKRLLRALGDSHPYLQRHEIEQLALRFMDDDCSKCLNNNNTCTNCGCNAEGRMNGWQDSCSAGNWGPIVDKEEWEKRKQEYKIKFKITYGEDNIGSHKNLRSSV